VVSIISTFFEQEFERPIEMIDDQMRGKEALLDDVEALTALYAEFAEDELQLVHEGMASYIGMLKIEDSAA
jgi:hypothetical protein